LIAITVRGGLAIVGALVLIQCAWQALERAARARRHTTVPELRGLGTRAARLVATRARVRMRVHQLTARPLPVEGLVVDQQPEPGTRVRRGAEVRVDVRHPPEPPDDPH
jgi:beta-lactam-binding protein with PASTA domain